MLRSIFNNPRRAEWTGEWKQLKQQKSVLKAKIPQRLSNYQSPAPPQTPNIISVSQNKHGKKIETREHEDGLQKSKLLFHLNPNSIALLNLPERKFIDVNEASLQMFCFSRDEILGKTIDELNIFVQPEKRQKILEQLIKHGHVENCESEFRRKDGTTFYGIFSGKSLSIGGKNVFSLL